MSIKNNFTLLGCAVFALLTLKNVATADEFENLVQDLPDHAEVVTLTPVLEGVKNANDAELQSSTPLGRGIRSKSSRQVLQLYCLMRDPSNENICLKAQYALFKDDELKPKDAFGNEILVRKSLTGIGPIMTVEEGAKVKDKLAQMKDRVQYPHLKFPKVQFKITKWWYSQDLDSSGFFDDTVGPLPIVGAGLAAAGGAVWVAIGTDVAIGSAIGGVGAAFFVWPLVADVGVNAGKESLALVKNSAKILVTPVIAAVRGVQGIFSKSQEKVVNSFTDKTGFNWSEKPMTINNRFFEKLVQAVKKTENEFVANTFANANDLIQQFVDKKFEHCDVKLNVNRWANQVYIKDDQFAGNFDSTHDTEKLFQTLKNYVADGTCVLKK